MIEWRITMRPPFQHTTAPARREAWAARQALNAAASERPPSRRADRRPPNAPQRKQPYAPPRPAMALRRARTRTARSRRNRDDPADGMVIITTGAPRAAPHVRRLARRGTRGARGRRNTSSCRSAEREGAVRGAASRHGKELDRRAAPQRAALHPVAAEQTAASKRGADPAGADHQIPAPREG